MPIEVSSRRSRSPRLWVCNLGDDTDLWSSVRDASGAVVSDMFEVTGRSHRQVSADAAAIVALRNAAPAIAAAVGELERLRAETARQRETIRAGADAVRSANASTTEIGYRLDDAGERFAALERQVCRLVSGQEIDGDRLCQHHGAEAAALALLSDERAAHAEASRDLDALLTALGAQVTPGGQTEAACHARRVADGMRLARELVAAREVPADVEAAIASLDAAAYRRGRDPAKVGGPPDARPRRGDPVIPYPTALLLLALIAAHRLAWQSQIADAIDVEAVS